MNDLDPQQIMTLTNAADLARKLRRGSTNPHTDYWTERLERACGELLMGREQAEVKREAELTSTEML